MEGSCHEAGSDCILKQKKEATKGRKRGIRGSEEWRERERGHSGTRQRKPSQRDKTGWQGKREGARGRGKTWGRQRRGEAGEAAGTQLMSPQSLCLPPLVGGQRSCRPPPPTLLRSPSLFLALPSCYVMKLEEEWREEGGEGPEIYYLFIGALKGLDQCFFFCMF